jgi:hypothetical protein
MRLWSSLACISVAALALGGCASGEESTVPAVTVTATVSETPEPEATPEPEPVDVVEETDEPEEQYYEAGDKSDYESISDRAFRKIVKDADAYAGERVIVYANVFQFDGATGDSYFLANASGTDSTESLGDSTYFDADDTASFVGDPEDLSDVVEEDIVKVHATVLGSETYERAAGGTNTVPRFQVDYIKVLGSTS